jgi:hypothetical protein
MGSTASVSAAGKIVWVAALTILARLVLAVGRQPPTRLTGSAGFARACGDRRLEPATGRRAFLRPFQEAATVVATMMS